MKWPGVVAALFVAAIMFYIPFVHYTEPNQVAIAWNMTSGETWLDDVAGPNVTPPWVLVSRIDTRPMRVCVTTAGRGFSCKLVEFRKEGWREFVRVEGFRYWWWDNRISFNFGYDDEYRGMKDLMRGHAYGVKQYPFVRVIRELAEGE